MKVIRCDDEVDGCTECSKHATVYIWFDSGDPYEACVICRACVQRALSRLDEALEDVGFVK